VPVTPTLWKDIAADPAGIATTDVLVPLAVPSLAAFYTSIHKDWLADCADPGACFCQERAVSAIICR
jgi:hypothetical protein